MQLTLRQVEAFLMVANLSSFTATGQALHISQSAVSSLIKELEVQVGVPLFDRTSRLVSLSPDGKELYSLAKKAFHEFQLLERYAGDLRSLRAGRVRIVGAPLISCTVLPVIMASFKRIAPNIKVELVDLPMVAVQSNVQNGNADIGFGPARKLEMGITSELFFTTPVCILSRTDHPLAGRDITWEDVKKTPAIAVDRQSVEYVAADIGMGTEFIVSHVVNQMPTAFALAAAGCGVAFAGRFSLIIASGYGLMATLPSEPKIHRKMLVYRPVARRLSKAAQAFLEFAHNFIATHDPDSMGASTLASLSSDLTCC